MNRVIKFRKKKQFTGMLDKKGAEIYEGDTLRTITGSERKVIYSNQFGAFCLEMPDGKNQYFGESWVDSVDCEIINK